MRACSQHWPKQAVQQQSSADSACYRGRNPKAREEDSEGALRLFAPKNGESKAHRGKWRKVVIECCEVLRLVSSVIGTEQSSFGSRGSVRSQVFFSKSRSCRRSKAPEFGKSLVQA